MRCNPWRWLWGLIPLALLLHITLLGEREAIEAELQRRTSDALARAGLQWVSLTPSGRDIVVTGRAADESEHRRTIEIISRQKGVRAVEDRIELVAVATRYVWSAALRGRRLVIAGHVPSEAMRKAVVGTAKATFPSRELDDEMQLARGAPNPDQWLGAVSFALKLLARLKDGSHVQLVGMQLTLKGEAEDGGTYQSIKAALANGLPQGVGIEADKLAPPRVRPYQWSAVRRGQQLELTGHAPGERERDDVFDLARKSFPKSAIVERMSIAAGEPRGWREAVGAALTALAALEEGRAELGDTQLSIAGSTELEDTAEAVGKGLRSALPAAFKLTEQIKWKQPAAAKVAAEAKRKAEAEAQRAAAEAEAQRVAALQRARAAEQEEARRRAAAELEERRRAAAELEARRKEAAEQEARRHEQEARRQAELARCREELGGALPPGSVSFARASADLGPGGRSALDRLAEVAGRCTQVGFEIAGHADAEGTSASKQKLSERRAQAVLDYLARAGVDSSRMRAVGYADAQPLAANDTERDRARNRRVSINVRVE
jgi:OOP family OmpA-OmpF porin